MNDRQDDFDAMLVGGLPPPDDDTAAAVTPWRRAMRRMIAGLALSTVTLQFWGLQYLLPSVGILLLLLGLRSLRRENPAMRACYVIACARTGIYAAALCMCACVRPSWMEAAYRAAMYIQLALVLAMLIALWQGLAGIRRKAGFGAGCPSAGWMVVWYASILALGLAEVQTGILGLVLLALYIAILIGLHRMSRAMDEAGYVVCPAPVKLSDKALAAVIVGVTMAGMACGYLFINRYPMKWEPTTPAPPSETADALLAMGFPAEVLADLTAEEIAAMDGALRVEGGVNVDFPYEPRMSHVAVQLPCETDGVPREKWRIIHHFAWLEDPGFRGTEAIQLWPTTRSNLTWRLDGDFSGRLLIDRSGMTLSAAYHELGWEHYDSDSTYFGRQTNSDLFATFSFPESSSRQRGYIIYDVLATATYPHASIIDSWVNYVHQKSPAQFPVQTAKAFRMQNSWLIGDVFYVTQTALQFYPYEYIDK